MNPIILVLNSVFVAALLVGLNHFVSIPDPLFYPINIYGIIIGINLILSVQFSYTNAFKSAIVPVGAFLFVMSDIFLAIGKFEYNSTSLQITVMLTYGVAQFLIVLGALRYFRLNE